MAYTTNSGEVFLNITEAAKEIGVVPSTLRNWEKQGLFIPRRSENGYRIFNLHDISKLKNLKQYSKTERMSANAIRMLFHHEYNMLSGNNSSNVSKILKSQKWKDYRIKRGFILEDVARAINISPSYLYKIENDQTNVSLDILQRLADFYGENLLYYIEDDKEGQYIVKKNQGEPVDIGIEGVAIESLVAINNFSISAMLYTIAPECGRTVMKGHSGEEFFYVLSGKVHFTLLKDSDNPATYVLSANDSFSFHSTYSHSWFNHGKKEVKILWIYSRGS